MTTRVPRAAALCLSLRLQQAAPRRAWLPACLALALAAPQAMAQTPVTPAAPQAPLAAKPGAVPVAAKVETRPDPKPDLKPDPKADDDTVPSVTVSAERPTNRIDRQVYDVKSDVSSTNSSAADVLANVPSVAVDPDGAVTLRGNSNVQILVDGKPSAMLQGENRGAALNAMAADDIESIEVINNPGAQFGNEGGGGPILNLVMRRNKRPGGLGVANANLGSAGRYNSALSGGYNEGLWAYQGSINVRHDGRDSHGDSERVRIDPLRGTRTRSTQTSSTEGLTDSSGLTGQVTYAYGTQDRFNVNAAYNKREGDTRVADSYVSYGAESAVVSDYLRRALRDTDSSNYGWGSWLEHKGERDGEVFKMDLRVSSSTNGSDSSYNNEVAIHSGSLPIRNSHQRSKSKNKVVDYTGDYELPIDKSVLKLGYKLANNDGSFNTYYANVAALGGAETVVPSRTNDFVVEETNVALYGSYQMRLDQNWGVLGGLRAEHTTIEIHQYGVDTKVNYLSYIPSFYVNYRASDKSNIRLAYAHRIRRPNPQDLNPFVVYRDEFNVSSGNPKLMPSETDSIELGYDGSVGMVDANLRAFFRREKDLISERRYFIADNVLLTTRANGGNNDSGGLEFSLSAKPVKGMTLNGSGNLSYFEQTSLDTAGLPVKRSITSLSLRGRMNYQLSEADQLQLVLNAQGKTLSSQSYREPNSTANLSYRRTLSPRLNLVFNVTDVFNSNKMTSVIDSDILKERNVRHFDGRVMYLGLSYRLGGVTGAPRAERGERGQGMQRRGAGGGGRDGGGNPGGGNPGGGDPGM